MNNKKFPSSLSDQKENVRLTKKPAVILDLEKCAQKNNIDKGIDYHRISNKKNHLKYIPH